MEIVVYSPEIAGNVGAIIRLSANSGVPVNFIKPFGFNMQENKIRRAGLDYHDLASAKTYETWEEFISINKGAELCSLTSKSTKPYWNASLNIYDFLIFGPESVGLPDEIINKYDQLTIPMQSNSRSINLANSVSIVMYEAIRQKHVN